MKPTINLRNALLRCFFLITVFAYSQNPGDLDTSFNSANTLFPASPGTSGKVWTIALQDDGKVIMGGQFSIYNGIENNSGVVRANEDGSIDETFSSGISGSVYTVVVLTDGKIMIGGHFHINGSTTNINVARLNSDGSIDTSFNQGTGANGIVTGDVLNEDAVYDIVVQADGKMLIAGYFLSYNGTAQNNLIRVNSDGSLDTSFQSGLISGPYVISVVLQSDNKIVIGGRFSSYGGVEANSVARLNEDGTLDNTFNSAISQFDVSLRQLVLQPDGKILVASLDSGIRRLNSDGSYDSSFIGNNEVDALLYKIALLPDGKILAGGFFFNGYNYRLNSDGTIDTSYNSGGVGASGIVYAITVQPNGKAIIGGDFLRYNNVAHSNIVRTNADGTIDTSFNLGTGADGVVQSIIVQPDNKILVAGSFTTYNGASLRSLARCNNDGTLDTSFTPGLGPYSSISSMLLQLDNKILIAGSFTTYNGISQKRIARLNTDGSLDATFNSGTGANNTIEYMVFQPDGKILIGGSFTTYNDVGRNRIARLNADGSLDTTFNPSTGANSTVMCITIQSDGKIVIGGSFTSFNDVAQNYLTRLNTDGSLDTGFAMGTGPNYTVYEVVSLPDDKILVGGWFNVFNGVNSQRIARLNADGSYDDTFSINNYGSNIVNVIKLQPDGKILIGYSNSTGSPSQFDCFNSDGTQDVSYPSGIGPNGAVYAIAQQPDGKILLGGSFTSYQGTFRNSIAKIYSSFVCETPEPSVTNQVFCNSATTAELVAEGESLNWYSTVTDPQPLAADAALLSGTYYVSQTINSCEGPRAAVNVSINTTSPPQGEVYQVINEGVAADATLEDLTVSGTEIKWYDVDNNLLPADTQLINSETYYATQTIDGCESETFAVTVEVVLGTTSTKDTKFSYYPNPVSDNLHIVSGTIIGQVEVYNLTGQKIVTLVFDVTEADVNMAGLAAGSYLVRVSSGNSSNTVMVMKK